MGWPAPAVTLVRLAARKPSGELEWRRDAPSGCGGCYGMCELMSTDSRLALRDLDCSDATTLRLELPAQRLLHIAAVLYLPPLLGFAGAILLGFGVDAGDGVVAMAAGVGVLAGTFLAKPLRVRMERAVRADLIARPGS